MEEKGFFRNHADTVAIIGVNIAIGAILISMWISHASRIDAVNSRMDTIHMMIYDMLKDTKK